MQKPVRMSGHAGKRMARYRLGEDVIRALRGLDRAIGLLGKKVYEC